MFRKIDIERIGILVKIFPNCVYRKNKKYKQFFTLYLTKMLPFIDKIKNYSVDAILTRRSFCKLNIRKDDSMLKNIYLKNAVLYLYRK
jgi:hypothetical protein